MNRLSIKVDLFQKGGLVPHELKTCQSWFANRLSIKVDLFQKGGLVPHELKTCQSWFANLLTTHFICRTVSQGYP